MNLAKRYFDVIQILEASPERLLSGRAQCRQGIFLAVVVPVLDLDPAEKHVLRGVELASSGVVSVALQYRLGCLGLVKPAIFANLDER